MQELGTLGGNDATAFFTYRRPFFWEKDTMLDIGSL
jgi:hypothetical protein